MLLSEKLTLIIAVWILIALFVTGRGNLEIFFILVFIGILVVRELSDVYSPVKIKDRLNVFIYLFLFVFIVIVGKKIISIVGF